ncbi:MAG: PRC-barrel domain-containing protein [Rhizomicrobium sp.]
MTRLLGTAAVAALLFAAAPAVAQQSTDNPNATPQGRTHVNRSNSDPAAAGPTTQPGPTDAAGRSIYNTNPTPQEREQTNQLNTDAAADARTPPTPPAADAADYANKKAEYDRQMRNYDAQRAAYDRDRARYRADRGDFGHRWDAFYGFRGFRNVDRMRAGELRGVRVSARGGDRIGRVRDVDADRFGRIERVAVSTGRGAVWIDADDLRFDPVARVVYTDLSRREVDRMGHVPRF